MAVFLSYSSADKSAAGRVVTALAKYGLTVWSDAAIRPGQNWDETIEAELRTATSFLLLLSPSSVASRNVLDEIALASNLGLPIVCAVLERCQFPLSVRTARQVDLLECAEHQFHELCKCLQQAGEIRSNRTTRATDKACDAHEQIKIKSLVNLSAILPLGVFGWLKWSSARVVGSFLCLGAGATALWLIYNALFSPSHDIMQRVFLIGFGVICALVTFFLGMFLVILPVVDLWNSRDSHPTS